MKGYVQTIDNLVYYGIIALQTNTNWDKLDEVVTVCAETYNKTNDEVIYDYSIQLKKQLLNMIYN
jgi:hypothetical protein